MKPLALISIHDVMPCTLADVRATLDLLASVDLHRVSLLVVPGVPWSEEDLDALRALVTDGHELVAHGWQHETRPRRPLHRLHAMLISRNAAEHLSLSSDDIARLMCRSQRWFAEHALQVPETYIPPAWALGGLSRAVMASLPYSMIETLSGVHVRQKNGSYHLQRMPLLGFEADSATRVRFLTDWNRLQLRLSRRLQRPPRIALHPADHRLPLGEQLRAILALGWTGMPYRDLSRVVALTGERARA